MSDDADNPAALPSFEINAMVRGLRARVAELEAAIRAHRERAAFFDGARHIDRLLYRVIDNAKEG